MSTQWIGRGERAGGGSYGRGGKKNWKGNQKEGGAKAKGVKREKERKKGSGHHTYGNRVTFWLLEAVRLWG